MIDPRHELVKLAALIGWDVFVREWVGFFPSGKGRPATEPRLVAGFLYLQHAYLLSHEAVVARWVENPCYQHLTGEVLFQHKLPIDPSSLTRWRGRIGEEGVEWLLTQTIRAGQKSSAIDEDSVRRVAVDTSVSEKNIAYPRTPGFMSGRAISWSPWRGRLGWNCGNPTPALRSVLHCRWAAMPMPSDSSACARH